MEPPCRPQGPGASETDSKLPEARDRFIRELLRRLELLKREIRALDSSGRQAELVSRAASLSRMESEIRDRLLASRRLGPDGWPRLRSDILVLWQRYRHEFESLALSFQRRHTARPGQRNRGPRW